jgi:hypothetical protein
VTLGPPDSTAPFSPSIVGSPAPMAKVLMRTRLAFTRCVGHDITEWGLP